MRFFKTPHCPECNGKITMGVAINPILAAGGRQPISPLNTSTLSLIPVFKCKNCGYSCDHEDDLI